MVYATSLAEAAAVVGIAHGVPEGKDLSGLDGKLVDAACRLTQVVLLALERGGMQEWLDDLGSLMCSISRGACRGVCKRCAAQDVAHAEVESPEAGFGGNVHG